MISLAHHIRKFRNRVELGRKTALLAMLSLIAFGLAASPQSAGFPPATPRRAAETHNILIGTAAASAHFAEAKYAGILGSEFNQLEAENEMKFGVIHPRPDSDPEPYDFHGGDALVVFAQKHDMVTRGHTLVWHNQLPEWITKGDYSTPELSKILHDHIRTVMTHYKSNVYAWDVVNEAFNDDGSLRHTIWYDEPGIVTASGTQYIEQALRWAREADPSAKLFYNDYDAEEINRKSDAIYAMAADFKKRGVPLDGIGFQTHISLAFADPARIASFSRNLQRFADLGIELQITELDIRLADSKPSSFKAQAKLYGQITTLCVHQPGCKALQTWGFTDKHSWIPAFDKGQGWALLWDAKYRKKPAYKAVAVALGN